MIPTNQANARFIVFVFLFGHLLPIACLLLKLFLRGFGKIATAGEAHLASTDFARMHGLTLAGPR